MTALQKVLRSIVLIGIFALPFVPLIVTTSLFFPYITGKNFTFRLIVEVIAGAWLALALVDAKYRPRRSWILGAFAIFVFIIAVADAQGANPFKSFWSNYERMDGWVTIAHLLLYIVVAAAILNSEKIWRYLFQLSLAVSAYISITGLGDVITGANSTNLQTRIDLTFGNPIYLAVYMLFHVFLGALLWAQMRREGTSGKKYLWLSIAYGVVMLLDTIALFSTSTRGTELGLIGGGVLAFLLFSWIQGSRRMRFIAFGCVAVVIVLGGVLHFARNSSFILGIGSLQRLASISLSDDTVYARVINIETAWKGVKERPILGWGQENYAIVFDKYYDPRMYGQEQWFDRVHDIIFDWWIAGGTLGLLAYLSIFVATLWLLWKSGAFDNAEKSILTGLLAGYFIHNLTVFDNITSYILFGTVLAYISWRAGEAQKKPAIITRQILPSSSLPFVALGCALLVWGVAWEVNAKALAENRILLQGLEQQPSVDTNLSDLESAISYGTYGTQEAREQLVQVASSLATSQSVSSDTKQAFFTEAVSQMMLQEKASPLDARFPLFLGVLEDAYGDYSDAQTALTQAHALSPDKQSILFEMGLNAQARGDTAGAEQIFETAYNLDTDDTQARVLYAAFAIRTGNDTLADQLLAPIIASGQAADPNVAQAYAARNEYNKIVPIWQAYVATNPTDPQGYLTLAAAYYEIKESDKAIQVLQTLIQEVPSSADQANTLITQIKNGTVVIQ